MYKDKMKHFGISMSGSCVSEGYTGCCESGDCRGGELSRCFCDEICYTLEDCCDDILDIACSPPGTYMWET